MNEYEKLEYIIQTISEKTNMPKKDIFAKGRKREKVGARQLIHYYAKKYTKLSLSEIGFNAGNKNHATVLYGDKVVKDVLSYDKNTQRLVEMFDKIFDRNINKDEIESETIKYIGYSKTTHYSNGLLR